MLKRLCTTDIFLRNLLKLPSNKILKAIKDFYNNGKSGLNILIFTGEIPVKANYNSMGGRNQHLSTVFLSKINHFKNFHFVASLPMVVITKRCSWSFIDDRVVKNVVSKNIDYQNYIKNTNTYYLHKKTESLIYGDYLIIISLTSTYLVLLK